MRSLEEIEKLLAELNAEKEAVVKEKEESEKKEMDAKIEEARVAYDNAYAKMEEAYQVYLEAKNKTEDAFLAYESLTSNPKHKSIRCYVPSLWDEDFFDFIVNESIDRL